MTAYKLLRVKKDGTFGPLFINRKQNIPIGVWLDAEFIPTKGFAERKGWHCTLKPNAPHLKKSLKSGEKRVWFKVEVTGVDKYKRPESQGGTWLLSKRMRLLKRIG